MKTRKKPTPRPELRVESHWYPQPLRGHLEPTMPAWRPSRLLGLRILRCSLARDPPPRLADHLLHRLLMNRLREDPVGSTGDVLVLNR
jgi:hypothetical protein